jgi:fatty acid desaturase
LQAHPLRVEKAVSFHPWGNPTDSGLKLTHSSRDGLYKEDGIVFVFWLFVVVVVVIIIIITSLFIFLLWLLWLLWLSWLLFLGCVPEQVRPSVRPSVRRFGSDGRSAARVNKLFNAFRWIPVER